MSDVKRRSIAAGVVGGLLLLAGLAAFLVPLGHAGPYGIPGRGLVGGLLCLLSSFVLFARGTPAIARGVQRLGGALGMFGDGPGPETITLRLDPCV